MVGDAARLQRLARRGRWDEDGRAGLGEWECGCYVDSGPGDPSGQCGPHWITCAIHSVEDAIADEVEADSDSRGSS